MNENKPEIDTRLLDFFNSIKSFEQEYNISIFKLIEEYKAKVKAFDENIEICK